MTKQSNSAAKLSLSRNRYEYQDLPATAFTLSEHQGAVDSFDRLRRSTMPAYKMMSGNGRVSRGRLRYHVLTVILANHPDGVKYTSTNCFTGLDYMRDEFMVYKKPEFAHDRYIESMEELAHGLNVVMSTNKVPLLAYSCCVPGCRQLTPASRNFLAGKSLRHLHLLVAMKDTCAPRDHALCKMLTALCMKRPDMYQYIKSGAINPLVALTCFKNCGTACRSLGPGSLSGLGTNQSIFVSLSTLQSDIFYTLPLTYKLARYVMANHSIISLSMERVRVPNEVRNMSETLEWDGALDEYVASSEGLNKASSAERIFEYNMQFKMADVDIPARSTKMSRKRAVKDKAVKTMVGSDSGDVSSSADDEPSNMADLHKRRRQDQSASMLRKLRDGKYDVPSQSTAEPAYVVLSDEQLVADVDMIVAAQEAEILCGETQVN